ncbi:MAG TPA: hypothetical protein VF092_24990 [Longimicrobium sp.]
MSAALALRAAAVVALLQWAAHTAMILRARPRHGAQEVAVIEAMRSHRFDFAGAMRSYWDFYFGYGLLAAVVVLVEAVLFWQLAGAVETAGPLVRSIAILFLAYNLAHALVAARWFFITPIVPDVLVAACLAVAIVGLGS